MDIRVILETELSGWLVNFPLPETPVVQHCSWLGGTLGVVWDYANTLDLEVSHSCKHTCCASCCNLGSGDTYLPNFSHVKDKHLAQPRFLAPSVVKGERGTAKGWRVPF